MKPAAFSVPIALLTLPLLVACGDNARSETESPATEADPARTVTANSGQETRPGPAASATQARAAPSEAGFTVNVSLSPQAAARLQGREGIILRTYITGEALPSRAHEADDVGDIDLGSDEVTAAGRAGPIRLTIKNFKSERRGWIKGTPYITVNIFTARRSSPNNLITCEPLIHGEMAEIVGRSHEVQCTLIPGSQ